VTSWFALALADGIITSYHFGIATHRVLVHFVERTSIDLEYRGGRVSFIDRHSWGGAISREDGLSRSKHREQSCDFLPRRACL